MTLGEALPIEITRVRDIVLPQYIETGAAGMFAIAMMRAELERASMAMIDGDLVEMCRSLEALKEFA